MFTVTYAQLNAWLTAFLWPFARIAALLAERPGLRTEDVFVSLVEVAKENWSFGNGLAQYA